jgi:hypothetical protein
MESASSYEMWVRYQAARQWRELYAGLSWLDNKQYFCGCCQTLAICPCLLLWRSSFHVSSSRISQVSWAWFQGCSPPLHCSSGLQRVELHPKSWFSTFVVYVFSSLIPETWRSKSLRSSSLFLFFSSVYQPFLTFISSMPQWSSGQSSWLQIQSSQVRFPALPDLLWSSGSGTGSTQPREDNWEAIWMEKWRLRV